MECHRAGTEESLIAIAGNILKGQHDLHQLSGNLQQDTLTGWNERPPILSDHLRLSTCIPLNLANLHSPSKEQPSFAPRGRADVAAAKPLKKRGQFLGAANSTAGQQESTCGQQTPLTSRNTGAPPESLENLAQSAEPLAVDGGTAPFSASDASTLGDQAGDIAIGSGSAVSVPEDGGAGTKGATSGRDGSSRDSASALAGSSRKSSTSSEIDSASGAVIPGYVIDAAGYRPPDAGAIYPEVDKYVLYGADKRTAINVLGTEVCTEGEFLRSKEAAMISEIKTDYSKCRYLDFGDESVSVTCPTEAQTKIIHHNSYLSSPLVYSVRTCLEYDTSNCYLTTDQETEREMCRIDFEYEGLWGEGTKFFYRCSKSESRSYRQPLEYNIRWFMEVYIEERV